MDRKLLAAELTRDEGNVLHGYADSEGYLTIGIGRLIDARKGGGISPEESLYLFGHDVDKVEAGLDRRLPWWRTLSEVRQRVLANMCFNLGIDGLLGFPKMLAKARAGDFEGAADEMKDSAWHSQVGDRALRLEAMMRRG